MAIRPQLLHPCPEGHVYMHDIHRPESHDTAARRIPRIVFQTSKTRCLPARLAAACQRWQFSDHSYYFFDDVAMMEMLDSYYEEFPHLQMVSKECILKGTMRSDLWRYLVLWRYGKCTVCGLRERGWDKSPGYLNGSPSSSLSVFVHPVLLLPDNSHLP